MAAKAWRPCPFGNLGDRLWVRETWMPGHYHEADREDGPKVSVNDGAEDAELTLPAPSVELAEQWESDFPDDGDDASPVRPSIHMPRSACGLVLEITDVRVERLQAGDGVTDFGSRYLPEGTNRIHHGDGDYYYSAFRDQPHPKNWSHVDDAFLELWTNTCSEWDSNPWVWVTEFKRVERGQP